MAAHSSILAWEIPWTEESGRLQSMVSQKSWTQLSHQTTTKFKRPGSWWLVVWGSGISCWGGKGHLEKASHHIFLLYCETIISRDRVLFFVFCFFCYNCRHIAKWFFSFLLFSMLPITWTNQEGIHQFDIWENTAGICYVSQKDLSKLSLIGHCQLEHFSSVLPY